MQHVGAKAFNPFPTDLIFNIFQDTRNQQKSTLCFSKMYIMLYH